MTSVDFTQPTPIRTLLDYEFPLDRSYIEPYILTKGGTLLLGAEAKAGKSIVMAEAIRALTTGTPFLYNDFFKVPAPVKVLYLEQENGPPLNQDRFRKIYKDDDPTTYDPNLYIASKNMGYHFNDPSGTKAVFNLVKTIKPNVIAMDPISYMYNKEESSNTEIGKLFHLLTSLKNSGAEHELSLIFAHHFGKKPWGQAAVGYDWLAEYNFRGASKWKDGADTIITMGRHGTEKPPDNPWQRWKLRMRFLTRHGEEPPECECTVNWERDFKVKFLNWKGAVPNIQVQKIVTPKKDKDDWVQLLLKDRPTNAPIQL